MVDSISGANAAAIAEANRRAAEEAAKRAAEEAAKKAAAEAAKKAAAEAAKEKAAKAAPVDKKEGWLAELTETVVEKVMGKATPESTKADSAAIEKDMKTAKSPEDIKALSKRASELQTKANVSDDPGVQSQLAGVTALNDKLAKASAAADKIQQLEGDLNSSDPAVKANATAALLSRPKELTDAVKALGPFAASPAGDAFKARTEKLGAAVTPAALAKQLEAQPDLSKYPPDMAKNLLAMRTLNDPALNKAMDKVGSTLLAQATDGKDSNPLSYDALKKNPDLMRLVTPLQGSADPKVAEQFDKVVDDWGKEILKKSLDGKKGKDEVEDGLKKYQEEMLGLAKFGLDPTKVATATATTLEKNMDTIEDHAKDGGSRWNPINVIKDVGNWVKDKVGDLVGFVKDKVGDIAKAAAELFYDNVVDPALDHSALGEDTDTFKAEQTGIMGKLVTNRLEVGESAFIRLDANAAISGVKLGAGAQLEIKRVPKLDPKTGEPMDPVNGVPQTEIQVKVLADANAGVGLEAKFGKAMGKEKSVKGNDALVGGQVGGGAEVEAGVRGQAELVFSFDATDPKAIEDMTGLFKEAAETGLKAAIPGVGPILAAMNAPDAAKAAVAFAGHLETVRIEAGVYANASIEASAKVGSVEEQKNAVYKAGEEPEDAKKPETGKKDDPKGLKDKAISAGTGAALENAGLDLGSLQASVGGDLSAGVERNFKTGETTIYLQARASAKAQASTVGGLNAGAGADYNKKIAVTLGPDGKLKDLKISQEYTKDQFAGLGKTDIMGRVDSDVLAQVGTESTITVTRRYKNLDDFKGKSPTEVAGQLLGDSHNDKNPNLVIDDIKASETSKLELGGEIAGVGVKLTLGRTLEQDIEQAQWNETMKAVKGR